eukprot:PhM_4_TR18789/c0_g1_i2/m.75932
MDPALKDKLTSWEYLLKECLELERWGQQLEALELYERLQRDVNKTLSESQSDVGATQRSCMMKLSQCLQGRTAKLRNLRASGLDVDGIKAITESLFAVFDGSRPFPVELRALRVSLGADGATAASSSLNEPSTPLSASVQSMISGNTFVGGGTLLAPPRVPRGDSVVKITIDSFDLKDATSYLEPFIAISVRDHAGRALETPQDTPNAIKKDGTKVFFGHTCFLQTPLSRFDPNSNVFFEFKHWKPDKKKYSVRCWSMMSKAELVEGTACLEIYAKPTDYHAKTFKRHSSKDLFMHINVSVIVN